MLLIDAAVSYTDGNDDDNLIVPQDRLQRRVPVSQDNEDLVVKGAFCKGFCTGYSTMINYCILSLTISRLFQA